ncbi:MAG: hypothetical protein J5607_02145, partial [Clostridiales bacterium]|nr:hypothetical protein [Clostridiales bacterium]
SAKNGSGDRSEEGYCSTEDMIELLNECNVLSWNGYDKKGDKDMDFRFEGNINGEEIEAKGKMAYPKNFEDFVDGVEDLCQEGIE